MATETRFGRAGRRAFGHVVTAAGEQIPAARPHLLARSVLTSVSFLLLAIPALAVAGGYFFRVREISGYGRLLITNLPWLVLGAGLALALSLVAVRLGGRRFTALLAAASLIALAGGIGVGVQFAVLASQHGATYDVLRQARTPTPVMRGPSEQIVFATVDGEALHADVWRPTSGTGTGVLFIHGGGFKDGGPGLRPYLFSGLADAGSVVLDVEYRLSPPPRWQQAPADVLCALGWFQSKASEYGVDPTRIVVMGESAGGNLALMAAYGAGVQDADGVLTPSCDVTLIPPAGVIAVSPTADLAATWVDVRALTAETPFPQLYVGGTPTEFPDRYAAASVGRLIRGGLPPTLLFVGTNDLLVRVERMRDLADRLREAGSDVELVEVPFADHAFDGPANGFGMQLEETLLGDFLATLGG